jgi:hypothetical protein
LDELGFEQKDLTTATEVTESYISQLLTGEKSPPEPRPTELLREDGQILETPQRHEVFWSIFYSLVRNLSVLRKPKSRPYLLASIAYTKNNGKDVVFMDNNLFGARSFDREV